MPISIHNPAEAYTPRGAFSHAVQLGDLLFLAGQVALDRNGELVGPGDIHAQATQVMENLVTVLESCGSSLELVAKITTYTVDLEYRPAIAEVLTRFFGGPGRFPANTFLVVESLAQPQYLLEIEAIAGLSDG